MDQSVSIILVNYKGYDDTVMCIQSLLQITYENYHIIIVDNGAHDRDKFQKMPISSNKVDVIYAEENKGFADGNNIGIKYAGQYKPDFYLLLNNDTTVAPDFLDALVGMCNKNYGIITGRICYYSNPEILWYAGGNYDRKTGISDHYGYNERDNGQYSQNIEINFATGCLMLIPNQVLEKVGYLDHSYFMYAEDLDYCCRTVDAGFKIYYCSQCVIYHKVGMSMIDQNEQRNYYMVRNQLIIISKYSKSNKVILIYLWKRTVKQILRRQVRLKTVLRAIGDWKRAVPAEREETMKVEQ